MPTTLERPFMYVQATRHPDDIFEFPKLIVAADRGYINNDTVAFVLRRLGAGLIGTYNRTLGFPFAYGTGSVAARHKGVQISEKGERAVLYAMRNCRATGKNVRNQNIIKLTAIAYRDAVNGRTAFLVSSIPDLSNGWLTVSKTTSNTNAVLGNSHLGVQKRLCELGFP